VEARAIAIYRVAGPLVLGIFVLYGLVALGLVPDPITWRVPEWLSTLFAVVIMTLALGAPVVLVLSLSWGLALRRRPRVAAPLWLLASAVGLLLASALLSEALSGPVAEAIQAFCLVLTLCAALWATWVGWDRGRGHPPDR
jgi:hypothetical protein